MRHRYRVDLYDDVELEARLVDLVESMPRSRRQEFLRTMIKVGFLHTYGAGGENPSLLQTMPRASVERKVNQKEKPKEGVEEFPKTKADNSSKVSSDNNKVDNTLHSDMDNSAFKASPVKEKDMSDDKNNSSKQEGNNIPSINKDKKEPVAHSENKDSESVSDNEDQSDDDVVDSLDEFNGLFDGLNSS